MRVVIAGSPIWKCTQPVCAWINVLPRYATVVITKGAGGAQEIAAQRAKQRRLRVEEIDCTHGDEGLPAAYEANYEKLQPTPSVVLAFHRYLWNSKITAHLVSLAVARNITAVLCENDEETQEPVDRLVTSEPLMPQQLIEILIANNT